ncbi:MAG: MBL fold metallo-hydrolase [Jaaginema sp. PMC 1079.18]|nr:MBL fold metallo-hydrolase [Jaaginema sp. PMC 1080.18]MEC4850150.1 MBL fold metallo-hydrolase [Jaaginema sp. PMC 1079.18]MEC4866057.1 MBL fold metallo-hydrolase [Jaaginema sp. PMC 1078.18]
MNFDVLFWGVRDQIATPGKDTVRYGGNTACVEMRVGDHYLVFDGGTGLRQMGLSWLKHLPVEAHLFFTHCHWDRIQGFPFFVPAFIPINHLHIYGATASNGSSFEQRLHEQMLGPNFPVPIQVMQSKMKFYDITGAEKKELGDIAIEMQFLNRQHHSLGYRVNYQGKSVVYATGTRLQEQQDGAEAERNREAFLTLAHHADLLILDAPRVSWECADTPQTYEANQQLWRKSVTWAKDARAKQVVVSLHSPDSDDDKLDKIEQKMQEIYPHLTLAREGMAITIQ